MAAARRWLPLAARREEEGEAEAADMRLSAVSNSSPEEGRRDRFTLLSA